MRLTEGQLMGPIDYVGLSRAELYDQVRGRVWQRWVDTEPVLANLACLEDLWQRRGREADRLLGGLVRLAARDGGDDQLAAIAICHQLAAQSRRVAIGLRDLSREIDEIVAGALWVEIKTFAWRDHTRGYATWLIWETRASVLGLLLPTRGRAGAEREVAVDPLSPLNPWSTQPAQTCDQHDADASEAELRELLRWALAAGHLTQVDVELLLDIVTAGASVAETAHSRYGMCSQAAVHLVASRRAICSKTVMRHRDRIVQTLREAVPLYLAEAA
jgi:hypothetical protein